MLTRIVFVLLVVLNLGVGAWWLVRRPPAAPVVPAAVRAPRGGRYLLTGL